MVKFQKHYVTNGTAKARVSYSAFRMTTTGQECVTLYAKDWEAGHALREILGDEYENNSDAMTDYFEKGRCRLVIGHPLYAAALARCAAG